MDFALTEAQQQIRDQVLRICARFDDTYWLERDRDGDLPRCLLRRHGRRQLARHRHARGIWRRRPRHHRSRDDDAGGRRVRCRACAAPSAIHINIFGLNPVVVFGTDAQKRRMLPPLIAGQDKACFGVTEPNAGLNTTADHHARRTPRRSLRHQRHEDLDLHRAGRQQDPAAGAHHAARSGEAPQPRADAVLHRPRPRPCRGAADPQDGPPRGRLEHGVLRGHGSARSRTASARKARASAPCCTV